MKLHLQKLSVAILATMTLAACGGGGDGGSSSNEKPPAVNPTNPDKPTTPTNPDKPVEPPTSNAPELVSISQVGQKNHPNAALAAANLISLERQNCSVNGLSYDKELEAVSVKHAAYIKHVRSNTPINNMNPHLQQGYVNWGNDTGAGNPYYSGESFIDRLVAANYSTPPYYASENIVQSSASAGNGMVKNPELAAIDMVRGLLSAPYHLRTIVSPNRSKSGTSLTTYTPYGKSANKDLGYILVDMAASEPNMLPVQLEGITTYPCGGTTGTHTALYTESPDPTLGTGRNLRTDPIGQPVHILVSKAEKIKVSNVRFYDTIRKTAVPVDMIDLDKDPYKGTGYELPKNEAFILPLTDNLKSCEGKKGGSKTNCGLMGNTNYEVSFDVLIDDKTMQSKKFTFKTGNVNY